MREALEQNRVLILEMRNRDGNLAAAEQRNRFVIENADNLWVPHVNPGGMLERLLRESYNLRQLARESCQFNRGAAAKRRVESAEKKMIKDSELPRSIGQ